jgi:hypothetical protein
VRPPSDPIKLEITKAEDAFITWSNTYRESNMNVAYHWPSTLKAAIATKKPNKVTIDAAVMTDARRDQRAERVNSSTTASTPQWEASLKAHLPESSSMTAKII